MMWSNDPVINLRLYYIILSFRYHFRIRFIPTTRFLSSTELLFPSKNFPHFRIRATIPPANLRNRFISPNRSPFLDAEIFPNDTRNVMTRR